jgi:Zn finger protein HypA/HybF involved in hydrogenase expression
VEEITLRFDAENAIAKKTLAFVLSLGVFKAVNKKAIDISLEEAKKGRVHKYKNVKELVAQFH